MRFLRFLAGLKVLPEHRRLELYPPFRAMRIEVLETSDNWRRIRIRLPLDWRSKNPGGVMFGGWQAALADPIAALACARNFPGYSVWTRSMTIDFQRGGATDLELRFEMSREQEEAIRAELAARGRATPTFVYGFHLTDGTLCTRVENRVAIRPKGYVKATTPGADLDVMG
jgi:acyl-coenzyme A thioesterase PaaI-like protein